jgi:ribonuclease VapC
VIVIDSSALVAIIVREVEADRFLEIVAASDYCLLSSVSLLETSMVLAGRTGDASRWRDLDDLIAHTPMAVIPQDHALTLAAREAFLRYGKGRHPAALNLGDCAAYALAKGRGVPLLFKGNDFARTDIGAAA